MSCLTRKLQQNLTRYLKKNRQFISDKPPQAVRSELVDKGLCPSCVTEEQMREMLRTVIEA